MAKMLFFNLEPKIPMLCLAFLNLSESQFPMGRG